MLEKILSIDEHLFVFLNGLGSKSYDGLWLILTKQTAWIPLFIFLLYLILKKIGFKVNGFLFLFVVPIFFILVYAIYKLIKDTKEKLFTSKVYQLILIIFFISVLLLITDQTANLFKNGFQRLRPCNNPEINSFIRIVQSRNSFSFFSGHATNSMGVTTFLYLIFKKDFKYLWLLFLWPLIFAYSRIYLGLHYPLDIICGYLCGAILGFLMFKLYQIAQKNFFRFKVIARNEAISSKLQNPTHSQSIANR